MLSFILSNYIIMCIHPNWIHHSYSLETWVIHPAQEYASHVIPIMEFLINAQGEDVSTRSDNSISAGYDSKHNDDRGSASNNTGASCNKINCDCGHRSKHGQENEGVVRVTVVDLFSYFSNKETAH